MSQTKLINDIVVYNNILPPSHLTKYLEIGTGFYVVLFCELCREGKVSRWKSRDRVISIFRNVSFLMGQSEKGKRFIFKGIGVFHKNYFDNWVINLDSLTYERKIINPDSLTHE